MAGAYDAGRRLSPAAVDAWADAVGPFVGDVGRGPVLDLGAGTGRFSGLLARWSGVAVIAVEPAVPMARRARDKGSPGVEVVAGAAEAIPLRDRSVALAWLSQVVHHIDDLDRAASELGRVVRPGGRLLIRGTYGRDRSTGTPSADLAVYRYFPAARRIEDTFPTRRRVLDALGAAGFEVETTVTVAQETAASLHELHRRVASRADSTLAALGDDTFAAGLQALARDAAAETTPTPVVDHLDLTVLRLPGKAHGSGARVTARAASVGSGRARSGGPRSRGGG